jgi:hypothetical protein
MAQKSEPNMYVPYYYVHITLSRYKNQISHNIQEIFARLQIAKSAQPIAVHGQNFPCCIRTYVHTYGVKHSPEGFLRFGSNIFFFFGETHFRGLEVISYIKICRISSRSWLFYFVVDIFSNKNSRSQSYDYDLQWQRCKNLQRKQ